jgi:hypothetical protein
MVPGQVNEVQMETRSSSFVSSFSKVFNIWSGRSDPSLGRFCQRDLWIYPCSDLSDGKFRSQLWVIYLIHACFGE